MTEQLKYVCQILNKHQVKYLIVGGSAVINYGYIRLTKNNKNEESDRPDIDVWFEPTYTNYLKNLCNSLEDLGLDGDIYRKGSTNIKRCFISESFDDFNLDFLPELENFPKTFVDCYSNRTISNDDIKIPYISLEDLILSKEISNRPKDIEDIIELKKILKSQKHIINRFKDF